MEQTNQTQEFWYQHVKSCIEANLTSAKYCRQNNLTYSKFLYWRHEYTKNNNKDFIPIKFGKNVASEKALCEIETPQGHKIIIYHPQCLELLPKLLGVSNKNAFTIEY